MWDLCAGEKWCMKMQFPIFLDSNTHSQGHQAGYTSGLEAEPLPHRLSEKTGWKNECVISSSLERHDYFWKATPFQHATRHKGKVSGSGRDQEQRWNLWSELSFQAPPVCTEGPCEDKRPVGDYPTMSPCISGGPAAGICSAAENHHHKPRHVLSLLIVCCV